MIDDEARRRIREDLDSTFVVEAAAGTGKTTALIGRMVALLRTGRARLDQIVAVTFTEKAAGEMKLRLRAELEGALSEEATTEEQRGRFVAALAALEAARIGTIHSFCADLLRERPIEAGVDPSLEVISEDQERALVTRAFRSWFERRLDDPPPAVRRILRRRGRPPSELLLRASRDLVQRRDHAHPWRRPEGFDRDAMIDALVEQARSVGALAELAHAPDRDYLAGNLSRIARFVAELDARERVRGRDHDGLEAELLALRRDRDCWKHKGFGERYGEGLMRADVLSRRDELAAALDRFLELSGADLAAQLHAELHPVVEAYEELKARTGTLDFLDLLIRARDLIRDHDAVREALRAEIDCVFVDEFQDTDPLQAEILLTLASAGPIPEAGMLSDEAPRPVDGKLFLVGDPKQSIYRFRRADVSLYESVKRRLKAQGVERLTLSTSFRARPRIQRAINLGFAPMMRGAADGSQAEYVPLAPHREDVEERPSVIALPVPRPYGRWGKVWKGSVAESTADAVGAFVDWLLRESGWTLPGEDGAPRPPSSRDVCLLFRSTKSFGRNLVAPYAQALEARGIPHVLVGGRTVHDRQEVLAVATALRAIEHPSDELSVYAALRGPFFALSDEQLWLHRERMGRLHPLAPHEELLFAGEEGEVARALQVLRELHLGRNRRPIADTLARFLDATRAHAGIANWPNGEQALANVLRVLDLARRYETQGASSFRGFVEQLEERLDGGDGIDAPAVEAHAAGVRIMTVHKAKGLEFPVVILCDPTLSRRERRPSRYIDSPRGLWAAPLAGCAPLDLIENEAQVIGADEAEQVRLTYVAATRAEELLVVPCVGDEPQDGWVDPLHRALYPVKEAWREAEPAPGCPGFGDDSVLERHPKSRRGPEDSVHPGRHRDEERDVVWWDPRALGLGRQPSGGLRRTALLSGGESAGAERIEAHHAWIDARAATLARGAETSWRVRPVTAIAHEAERSAPEPRVEQTDVDRATRPGGTRFGTLVHAVLAECPLDPEPSLIEAMTRHQGRLLDAPEEEIAAAIEAARAAFAHAIFEAARAADERRRECPLTVPLDDGTSAEGVVDLAFRDGDRWTVVDFKTDRDRAIGAETHAIQLEIYARAVRAATGCEVDAVLFYV